MSDEPTSSTQHPPPQDKDWQQDVINRLAFAALNEQRRSRRWNIFFKSLLFAYLLLVLLMMYLPGGVDKTALKTGRH